MAHSLWTNDFIPIIIIIIIIIINLFCSLRFSERWYFSAINLKMEAANSTET